MQDDYRIRARCLEGLIERQFLPVRSGDAEPLEGSCLYRQFPHVGRVMRNVGRRQKLAHMMKGPLIERCVAPIRQRHLCLGRRRKTMHQALTHLVCPLRQPDCANVPWMAVMHKDRGSLWRKTPPCGRTREFPIKCPATVRGFLRSTASR